jgi:hypothetical protein
VVYACRIAQHTEKPALKQTHHMAAVAHTAAKTETTAASYIATDKNTAG